MKHNVIILKLALMMSVLSYAQDIQEEAYSLEECISIALENNLDLRSANLRANSAKINHQQSKANLLPSVNGNFNLGVNDGRSIDPFTNDFINQELTFSNMGLSLNMTVFNGFRLLNAAKQNGLNRQASELEIEAAKQDIVLNVTLAYLRVLNSKAVLTINKERLEATKRQLKIQEGFFENESGNPADYSDILGQIANDETNILNSESALNNATINLLQLLNLPEGSTVDPEEIMLELEQYDRTAGEVFQDAMQNLATFKANELRIEAAKKGVSVAKAQFIPEISFFAGLNSNYSSVAEIFLANGSGVVETGEFVTVNGENFPVLEEQTFFESQSIGYTDQLDNNLNTVVGVAVAIPLINGFSAKNNVALEKIRVEESLVQLERTRLQIKNAIEQVHFDMAATFKRYESFQKQVEAYQETFRINEIRFSNGISNFLNYITSKNNLDNAKINLTNAKFEYWLRVKVLDY
ncbi:MAG: TolC family protein, partial [Bacteroidota bacterium]